MGVQLCILWLVIYWVEYLRTLDLYWANLKFALCMFSLFFFSKTDFPLLYCEQFITKRWPVCVVDHKWVTTLNALALWPSQNKKMCLKLNAGFCDRGIYKKKWKTCKVSLSLYKTLVALLGWYRFFSAVTFSTKGTKPVPGFTPTVLVWFLSKAESDAWKIIDHLSHQSAKV